LEYENNTLVLQVESQFAANYIEDNYIELLSKALFQVFGPETRLQYRALIDGTAEATPYNNSARTQEQSGIDSQLNEHYVFDNFIAGEPNKLARTAGLAVAKQPGYTAFNPLFIYGGSGVGKTHLANAIGNQVKQLDPTKRVLYVSANTFKLQYQDAVTSNHIPDFLNFYQQIDVLIVDDIQYFSRLQGTQDSFFHIFNHLQLSHKQLILTSDRSPLELKDIDDRLLTRFKWGLSAEITRPDYALRKSILLSKMSRDGVVLSDEIVDFIATNVCDSVRDLEGVVASLLAYSTLINRDIDMLLAEQVVGRIVKVKPREIQPADVLSAVSEHFNVQEKAILSQVRTKEIMQARHIAMFLAKRLTTSSLSEIGAFMGHRTHATVLHSLNLIQDQIKIDPILRHRIDQIESVLMR
jgi:chromosomal replication initiator protein